MRILLVDDDADWRGALAEALEDLGYQVRQAETGQAALEALKRDPADVILLDVKMPGMTGEEVAAQLPAGGPPVVFLTGTEAGTIGSLRSGPFYYLPKNASPSALSMMLESLGA